MFLRGDGFQVHGIYLGLAWAYLLECEAGLVLVDAGLRGFERRIWRVMARLERDDLRLIFITHAHLDHYGSAAAVRSRTAAPIAIHQADARPMAQGKTRLGEARGVGRFVQALLPVAGPFLDPLPTPADLLVQDGDILPVPGLECQVIHTPGHTAGSCSLLVGGQAAFVGDLLTTTGRPHAQRLFAQDWAAIPTSLARLRAYDPAFIFSGHGRRPATREDLQRLA